MAFRALTCPSCGANIQLDDAKAVGFCTYCGEQILLKDIVEVRHVGFDPRKQRETALKELYAAREYQYLREEKQNQYEAANKKEKNTKLKDTKDYYISGGIGIGIMSLFAMAAFETQDKRVAAIMLIIILGIMFLIWNFVIKTAPEKGATNRAIKQQLHEETEVALKELDAVKYEYDNPTLPQQYFNIPAVLSLIDIIESRRADTMKEAINVYNDDGYKAEMKQIAENTQRAMEASARAAEQAARAAARRR